jgi:hypothetical protein
MALMMGPLRPDATDGEKQVFSALSGNLPDQYQVWPELPIQADEERRHPDFVVLHPMWGLTVLEVKDRKRIVRANPYGMVVFRNGKEEPEGNPVDDARRYAETIQDMIRDVHRQALVDGSYVGPLPHVSWTYGVVMSKQNDREISLLEKRLKARGHLLCRDDLRHDRLEERLQHLPRPGGVELLQEDELDLVRRALFPDGDLYDSAGNYVGHLSAEQEVETKDGIYVQTEDEDKLGEQETVKQGSFLPAEEPSPILPNGDKLELSEEGQSIVGRFRVKLVRGVAGCGKTQILCKRAILLTRLYPDWQILVLTRNRGLAADLDAILGDYDAIRVCNFDRLCYEQLDDPKVGLWRSPIKDKDQPGWIAKVCQEVPGAEEFDPRFLRDEFNWIKDIGRVDRHAYLEQDRSGRETPLPTSKREIVFSVFARHEERMNRFHQMVWPDVPRLMLDAMNEGLLPTSQYDAVLIDEAQMFPPTWFQVVKRWLRPDGMLFMAADTTQNIYARFSWLQKGINVRGRRTTILRKPYRSTFQIAQAAYELVRADEELRTLLRKEGDDLVEPDLGHSEMRAGPVPKLVRCRNLEAELDYVSNEIKRLIAEGHWPSDIAILVLKERTQQRFASHLRAEGIPFVLASEHRHSVDGPKVLVDLISGITGQEFRVVLVCDLQHLFDRDSVYFGGSWPEFKAQQKRLLYVAMTRARDHLCLCYRGNLHSSLSVLEDATELTEV